MTGTRTRQVERSREIERRERQNDELIEKLKERWMS